MHLILLLSNYLYKSIKSISLVVFCFFLLFFSTANADQRVINKYGGKIKAAHLKLYDGIIAEIPDFAFDIDFKVTSFDMVYRPVRNDIIYLHSNKWLFTKQMEKYISSSKKGDIFYFENIKVKGPDSITRTIPGVTFTIN